MKFQYRLEKILDTGEWCAYLPNGSIRVLDGLPRDIKDELREHLATESASDAKK